MLSSKRNDAFNLTFSGIMTALSFVIIAVFPEITIFFHLKINICDFPQILTGLLCGPLWGIASALLRSVFQAVWGGFNTFGIGEFINFALCSCMILSMYFIWKKLLKDERLKSPVKYYIAAAATIVITIIAGYLLNIAFLPLFYLLFNIKFDSAAYLSAIYMTTTINALKSSVNILPLYPAIYIISKYTAHHQKIANPV